MPAQMSLPLPDLASPSPVSERIPWLPDYSAYLDSPRWKAFRQWVLIVRGRRCERCGSPSRLAVHHVTYRRLGHEHLDDVRVLCEACHNALHALKRQRRIKTSQRRYPRRAA